MLKIGSLFSGIGTPELALKALGVEHHTLFACEIDKFARVTYLANNQKPDTFYEDVYSLDGKKYLGEVDVLVGGSPCQSFSIAGKRKGVDCARGSLIYEYFRIIEESLPKVFIYENVKGFLSIDKGETFKNFVQSFKGLGYTTYHQVLNTKDYGIPQNRERIYIVGFRDDVEFEFTEKQELQLRLKDMLEDSVDEKYHLSQKLVSYFKDHKKKHDAKGNGFGGKPTEGDGTESTITARVFKMGATDNYIKLNRTHTFNINGLAPTVDTAQEEHRQIKVAINKICDIPKDILNDNERQRRGYSPDGLAPSVLARSDSSKIAIANGLIEVENGEVKVKEAVKSGFKVAKEGDSINLSVPGSKTRRGRLGRGVAQTLDTACNQAVFSVNSFAQRGRYKEDGSTEQKIEFRKDEVSNSITTVQKDSYVKQEYIFRKLTPRECLRLQGFDDDFIFPMYGKKLMSDTQLYKQAGNGMSRNILEMVFTQIFISYERYINKKG